MSYYCWVRQSLLPSILLEPQVFQNVLSTDASAPICMIWVAWEHGQVVVISPNPRTAVVSGWLPWSWFILQSVEAANILSDAGRHMRQSAHGAGCQTSQTDMLHRAQAARPDRQTCHIECRLPDQSCFPSVTCLLACWLLPLVCLFHWWRWHLLLQPGHLQDPPGWHQLTRLLPLQPELWRSGVKSWT